jgi:hypothetical protein
MKTAKRAKLIRKLRKATPKPIGSEKVLEEEEVTIEVLPIAKSIDASRYVLVVEEGKAYRIKAFGRLLEVVGKFEVNGLSSESFDTLELNEPVVIDQSKSLEL